MVYCIKNAKTNLFVSYLKGITNGWTCTKESANSYTLIQAVVERMYIAKECNINREDLVIEQI